MFNAESKSKPQSKVVKTGSLSNPKSPTGIPAVNLIADRNDVFIDNSVVSSAKSKLSDNKALLAKYAVFFNYNYYAKSSFHLFNPSINLMINFCLSLSSMA